MPKTIFESTSIHPGFIWTPMVENFLKEQSGKSGVSVDELKKGLDEMHPIGHIGKPVDIAYGVLYLVSDEAKFVTGTEITIDGGYRLPERQRSIISEHFEP